MRCVAAASPTVRRSGSTAADRVSVLSGAPASRVGAFVAPTGAFRLFQRRCPSRLFRHGRIEARAPRGSLRCRDRAEQSRASPHRRDVVTITMACDVATAKSLLRVRRGHRPRSGRQHFPRRISQRAVSADAVCSGRYALPTDRGVVRGSTCASVAALRVVSPLRIALGQQSRAITPILRIRISDPTPHDPAHQTSSSSRESSSPPTGR